MTRPVGAPTPRAYLVQLTVRCPACGHTAAWHIVDGRCAYRTVSGEAKGRVVGQPKGVVASAEWCGCAVPFPVAGA